MENRWQLRFDNFKKALSTLEEVVPRYKVLTELEKDGFIQRFEFVFELSWKVMQDYLKYIGYTDTKGPRPVMTQMAKDGLIDPFVWEEILKVRNELAHIYDEKKSRDCLDKIVYSFYPELVKFKDLMESKR